ncbi:putative F-box domain-containing protein [Septoria linicola]|nr:putative F-box domain-containing protein [Septoria linicola]
MADVTQGVRGIFALPNEILLSILSSFQTKELIQFSTTNRHFHSLVVRLLHQRLQIAAALDGYTLYLECGPPAAKWTLQKVLCTALGTGGMQELSDDIEQGQRYTGILRQMGELHSRFRPVTKEPDWLSLPRPHPAGDIPGSRTYVPAEAAAAKLNDAGNTVSRTVGIDADCLFSQLETFAFLGRREATLGIMCNIVEVCRGTVRVWRDWLAKQCENKRWSDGEPVAIIQDANTGSAGSDSTAESVNPHKDASILWLNTGREDYGIKFRVKEQKWRRDQPILASSTYEMPVSYHVELEEILISTSRLLLNLEAAQHRELDGSGRALVFGSYSDYAA